MYDQNTRSPSWGERLLATAVVIFGVVIALTLLFFALTPQFVSLRHHATTTLELLGQ